MLGYSRDEKKAECEKKARGEEQGRVMDGMMNR